MIFDSRKIKIIDLDESEILKIFEKVPVNNETVTRVIEFDPVTPICDQIIDTFRLHNVKTYSMIDVALVEGSPYVSVKVRVNFA